MLRLGGTVQLTMLSKRNRAFGIGREIRPDTFVDDDSTSDKDHPHFYVDATALTAMLSAAQPRPRGHSWTSTSSRLAPITGQSLAEAVSSDSG